MRVTSTFQPRHSYIDNASRQEVLADLLVGRSKHLAMVGVRSSDGNFGDLAGDYERVALYRYGLGYPLEAVAEDLRGDVGALREMFRRRGTSRSRYYKYVERPAPSEAIARGDAPFFRVAVAENQSDLGVTDFSTTNSRRGFLSVCVALIVDDEIAERELAEMIWDPPGATYVTTKSEFCTFNDQRVAYALKAFYQRDTSRFEAELRGLRAAKPNVAAEARMLRAVMARDNALFVQGLDALLRWHRKEATRERNRNYARYYICISALGLARLAIREGICTPHDLPGDDPFLPLGLYHAGPNARSYTNKILVPFDPKRPEWKSSEFLAHQRRDGKAVLAGVETRTEYLLGRVIFTERSVSEKDLAGISSGSATLEAGEVVTAQLCGYIERLQPLRIDNIVMLGDCSEETVGLNVVCDTPVDFINRFNICACNTCESARDAESRQVAGKDGPGE